MSVVIKWMAMPENCCECPMETDYGTCGYYSMFVEAGHDSDYEKRPDDCPLIELSDAVKHGKWLPHPTEPDWDVCSVCGIGTHRRFHYDDAVYGRYDVEESFIYCPHCGAKMDGGEIHDHYNCTGCGFMSTCMDEEVQQCLKPHISQ